MFGILNFLLIGLDFESYSIKLICIPSRISFHSSALLVLRLSYRRLLCLVPFKTMYMCVCVCVCVCVSIHIHRERERKRDTHIRDAFCTYYNLEFNYKFILPTNK